MFQIKARIDYGLMIMFELAKNPSETIPLSGIAKKMKISSIYLIFWHAQLKIFLF
mgnify:CR=1 FL=1